MNKNSYLIVIESGENHSAFSPDVPGCVSAGRSVDETLKNMREALQLHLSDEETIPEPRGLAWHLANDEDLADESLVFA
jgi:predicted RNase H-like HicB family nuclease